MPALENEDQEPEESNRPGDRALGHLYAAKAEYTALAVEAGRSPQGRCYHIITTDIEKLIFVAQGYFPKHGE